jgi:hypothetical protein
MSLVRWLEMGQIGALCNKKYYMDLIPSAVGIYREV